jgi:diguanylate cyclase
LPEAFVRKLARRLPRDNAERQRHVRQLEQALADGKPKAAEAALEHYLDGLKLAEQPAWNELIATLLRQWEARQTGWTTARKRESLDRVLNAADPATLYTRLQGLLRGWSQSATDDDARPAEVRRKRDAHCSGRAQHEARHRAARHPARRSDPGRTSRGDHRHPTRRPPAQARKPPTPCATCCA